MSITNVRVKNGVAYSSYGCSANGSKGDAICANRITHEERAIRKGKDGRLRGHGQTPVAAQTWEAGGHKVRLPLRSGAYYIGATRSVKNGTMQSRRRPSHLLAPGQQHFASSKPEHIAHVVQTVVFVDKEPGGAQRAQGERRATARPMCDLNAFAQPREQGGVIADDVSSAHGGKPDRGSLTLASHAFSPEDGTLREVAPQRAGDHLAHAQRRTRRRIHLVPVMRLDDLDVISLTQSTGGDLE